MKLGLCVKLGLCEKNKSRKISAHIQFLWVIHDSESWEVKKSPYNPFVSANDATALRYQFPVPLFDVVAGA